MNGYRDGVDPPAVAGPGAPGPALLPQGSAAADAGLDAAPWRRHLPPPPCFPFAAIRVSTLLLIARLLSANSTWLHPKS
jgi:hypothetical protein